MQKRARASANVAGVNGDLFTWDEGLPSGMLMQSGVLEAPPHPKRSTLGITDDGSLLIDRVTMLGQWQGSGTPPPPLRALNGLNQRPGAQGDLALHSGLGRGHPAGDAAPSRSCSSRSRPRRRSPT